MSKILCNIYAALLLLLVAACGSGSRDAAMEQRATLLCGIIDECRYKDIARVEMPDGTNVFVIGLFTDKAKADNLASFITAMGVGSAECVERKK